jgi:hypothetical protein
MDELSARLDVILRRHAATYDQPDDYEQLRNELEVLIAEYGFQAVDAALDEAGPSASLH